MKNEFNLAFNEVLEEKQLPKDVIIKALESAMASAYRKAVNASNGQAVEAKIDLETGKFAIFAEKEIVDDVLDHRTEVTLEDALKADHNAEMGGMVMIDSTPSDSAVWPLKLPVRSSSSASAKRSAWPRSSILTNW
jgi:N utilization substance protein A